MLKWKLQSTQYRIILPVIIVFIINIFIFIIFIRPFIYKKILKFEIDKIGIHASTLAVGMDKNIRSAINELEAMASLDSIRSINRKKIDPVLSIHNSTTQFFLYYQVLDAGGRVISRPSKPERVGKDRSKREDFIAIAVTKNFKTHISKLRLSESGNISLVIATPILNNKGELLGILRGSMGIMDRNPEMFSLIIEPGIPDNWEVFLVSEYGNILAHSKKKIDKSNFRPLDFTGHPLVKDAANGVWGIKHTEINKRGIYAASAKIPSARWTVVVDVPENYIAGEVNSLTNIFFLFTAGPLIFLLLIIITVTSRMIGPLSRLTRALTNYGDKGEVELIEVPGNNEIAEAANAFNKMVLERKRYVDGLIEHGENLRMILDSVHTGIFIVNAETHTVVYANPTAADMVGISSAENIVGSSCFDYFCFDLKGEKASIVCPLSNSDQTIDNKERIMETLSRR